MAEEEATILQGQETITKGSVSIRFYLRGTSFCFVCGHLASGGKGGNEKYRNSDATEILSRTSFPRGPLHDLPPNILDHDGTATLIGKIVKAHPHLSGTKFDLPHVVPTSPEHTGVVHVGGDMFAEIPQADAIIMKV
ncbi:hypothetical protein IFM89_007203 [Coptis chinensis]|uniref:O-methyltransferase C-terminal domain-containing protein n=1 Tax=Coptis chinensis TaxID=261450 RepID=A0A835GZK2_9MAGN|nr:hypothetical protein IFM89_007203 [Coptis chinensis]